MQKSAALRNFVVGAVFLGSLALIGVVTLQVTGLSLSGKSSRLVIHFDKVSGLRTGDEVRIFGYRLGNVEEIASDFDDQSAGRPAPGEKELPIRVTLRVRGEPRITRDTQFLVKSSGPLGGNYVEIIPGRGDRKAIDSKDFEGSATADVFEELGGMVRENRQGLNEAILQIRDAVKAINEKEGALGAFIKDPVIRDRLSRSVESIEKFTVAIAEGKGSLGKFIFESKVHDDVEDLIVRLRRLAQDVDEGKGAVGMLIKDQKFADDFREGVKGLRDAVAGVNRGEGAIGVLLKDPETARSVREGVQDFKEIVAKVNQGEGTVGQMVNNREAWDRLVFVLRQVQEAVEDFREQAPINTFVNAIFQGI